MLSAIDRILLSTLAGGFSLLLGIVTLARDPKRRLNRLFASFVFCNAVLNLVWFLIQSLTYPTALSIYRLIQALNPIQMVFLTGFVHEFTGVYDRPFPRATRRCMILFSALFAPFYPSSLVIRGLVGFEGIRLIGNHVFSRAPGPLFAVNIGLMLLYLVTAFSTTCYFLRHSSGMKRNQTKFIAFALFWVLTAALVYCLGAKGLDLYWIYFPLQAAMNFFFAYAIFKYHLFQFNVWFRRIVIFFGVYLALALIPFSVFARPRSWFFSPGPYTALVQSLAVVAYGFLFSLAPTLATFLAHKAEARRLASLRHQLDAIRNASERLAAQTTSIGQLTERILDVLRSCYWDLMRDPPAFIIVVAMDEQKNSSVCIFPPQKIDEVIMKDFLAVLTALPPEFLGRGFTAVDLEKFRPVSADSARVLADVQRYLEENRIEVCSPCAHDDRLLGAVFLGAKANNIFSDDEVSTLQIASSNLAAAIRKSELLRSTKDLKDLDLYKKELISNVTHEFKSPLANIQNVVSLLLDDRMNRKSVENRLDDYLRMVHDNAGRLGEFIEKLLEISKLEQAKMDPRLESYDLNEVIRECVDAFAATSGKKGLTISRTNDETFLMLMDVEMVRQILSNLLSNALKFTSRGGVAVGYSVSSDRVVLSVRDTGRGIDPKYLPGLFEKFFQIPDDDHETRKGTGLGLAIARGWTEALGGRIRAESDGVGHGSLFIVELPLT